MRITPIKIRDLDDILQKRVLSIAKIETTCRVSVPRGQTENYAYFMLANVVALQLYFNHTVIHILYATLVTRTTKLERVNALINMITADRI